MLQEGGLNFLTDTKCSSFFVSTVTTFRQDLSLREGNFFHTQLNVRDKVSNL